MGLTKSELIAFFNVIKSKDFSGGEALTFGTQPLYCRFHELAGMMYKNGCDFDASAIDITPEELLKDEVDGNHLLSMLGFDTVVNLDLIPYADSIYVHDLCDPLPEELHDRFSLVLDGRTGYHVFNRQQVLISAAQACAVGGMVVHVCHLDPMQGVFAPFTPQLLTRFYMENGFSNARTFFCAPNHPATTFESCGPAEETAYLPNSNEFALFFCAVKQEQRPLTMNVKEWTYELEERLVKGHPAKGDCLKGKKVLIWGTGSNYRDNYRQGVVTNTHNFELLGFIDSSAGNTGKEVDGYPVYSPEVISRIEADAVLIANYDLINCFHLICTLKPLNAELIRNTYMIHQPLFDRLRNGEALCRLKEIKNEI